MGIEYWEPDHKCKYCGESYEVLKGPGRPRLFCCREHYKAFRDKDGTGRSRLSRQRKRAAGYQQKRVAEKRIWVMVDINESHA